MICPRFFQAGCHESCAEWYAEGVVAALKAGGEPGEMEFDLSLKALKEPFCKFINCALTAMDEKHRTLGWKLSGLDRAWTAGAPVFAQKHENAKTLLYLPTCFHAKALLSNSHGIRLLQKPQPKNMCF